jgi:hypothetical protein
VAGVRNPCELDLAIPNILYKIGSQRTARFEPKMKLRIYIAVALVATLLGFSIRASAQDTLLPATSGNATNQNPVVKDLYSDDFLGALSVPGKHVTAEALGDMNLRDSPPKSVAGWYSRGDKIGIVRMGEKLRILDYRSVQTPFDVQYWLKVAPVNPEGAGWNAGWIYYGGNSYLKLMQENSLK